MVETEIKIGANASDPLYDFIKSKGHIKAISGVMSSSMVGDELAIDNITFTVDLELYRDTLYSPTNADAYQDTNDRLYAVRGEIEETAEALRTLPNGTPVRVYHSGTLFGKFYSKDVKRLSLQQFTVTATSPIQILQDAPDHMGGLYSGVTFLNLLREILGGTAGTASAGIIPVTGGIVKYYVSQAVSNARVYGWLPKATPRDNIHQMLFAHGVNIFKHTDGDILFDYLTSVNATDVPDERVFLGGSITYTPPATRVELTEHTYVSLQTDEQVVLLNNMSGGASSDEVLVTFRDGPCHDYTVESGMTLLESGVNYVRVRGTGILKGKKYHHTTYLIDAEAQGQIGGQEKTVSSEKCTLISPLNGDGVLDRMISYYLSARKGSADIKISGERPGNMIRYKSVFGETETAFLASMNYKISGFVRATCSLISNYFPANAGNDYTNMVVLSASGNWTVPAGITRIMVVLIGGGSGGQGGNPGGQASGAPGVTPGVQVDRFFDWEHPSSGSIVNPSYSGEGGTPGNPGSGGKIYKVTIGVTPGQVLTASIGGGGNGGAANGGAGNTGGATTFGGYSSNSGVSSQYGYYDILSGNTYALDGKSGISGSPGKAREVSSPDIVVDNTIYHAGSDGGHISNSVNYTSSGARQYASADVYGGYGGGAAYKANGGNGRSGGYYLNVGRTEHTAYALIAVGGNGGNAVAPPNETALGRGGTGGNGGGGVGGFGRAACGAWNQSDQSADYSNNYALYQETGYGEIDQRYTKSTGASGALGTPGNGSAGGKGAPGCVLVYY